MIEISAKERKKILKSLRGGTVPNQGILRLAVGRNNELNAILKDCEDISEGLNSFCLLYTSPSPRDGTKSRMPSSA